MYASAALAALAVFFFWNSPHGWSLTVLGAYLIGMLAVMRLCISLYEVPSAALAPELAPDYHERTSLFSYRFFFGVIGGLAMNVVLYRVFLSPSAGGVLNREGYAHYGVLAAAVMGGSILVSSLGTHGEIKRLSRPPARRVTLKITLAEMAGTLGNPSLVVVMLSGLLSGVATGMTAALSQYFYLELWGLSAAQISNLAFAYVIASIVAVSLAGPLSKVMGKKRSMISVFVISLFTAVIPLSLKLLGFMPPNASPLVFLILFADALVSAALGIMGYIIISSMIADVVEDAAVKTGVRSEGLLFAANGLLPKFTAGLGVFAAGLLLTMVRFPVHAAQGAVGPVIMRHLAILYLPISAVMSALSILALAWYRIDRHTHERNLETLRDAAAAAEIGRIEEAKPRSAAGAGLF